MWDCPGCGCRCIAASLAVCPMCGRERDMPKATVSSGASNANALPGEPGYMAPEEAVPDVAVETPETPAEPPADAGVPGGPEPVQAVSEPAPKPSEPKRL